MTKYGLISIVIKRFLCQLIQASGMDNLVPRYVNMERSFERPLQDGFWEADKDVMLFESKHDNRFDCLTFETNVGWHNVWV